jgi:hypothetical protein
MMPNDIDLPDNDLIYYYTIDVNCEKCHEAIMSVGGIDNLDRATIKHMRHAMIFDFPDMFKRHKCKPEEQE